MREGELSHWQLSDMPSWDLNQRVGKRGCAESHLLIRAGPTLQLKEVCWLSVISLTGSQVGR